MKYIVVVLIFVTIVSNIGIVYWTKHCLNNMTESLIAINQLATVERGVLLRICKLELGTSLEGLNETLRAYELAIRDNNPPVYIAANAEILRIDVERHETLMEALIAMEKNR